MAAEWELLRALFERVLERGPAERAAFLDEHTKDDPQLRRDIESLLAVHERAEGFLSSPALDAVGPLDVSPGPPRSVSGQTRLAPGTSLGAFTIVELLGAGGM